MVNICYTIPTGFYDFYNNDKVKQVGNRLGILFCINFLKIRLNTYSIYKKLVRYSCYSHSCFSLKYLKYKIFDNIKYLFCYVVVYLVIVNQKNADKRFSSVINIAIHDNR